MARRLVFLLRRSPSMTREAFQSYWRTTHGPLVAQRADVLGIRRYQQVHTVRDGRPGTVPAFDGVAELWFDPTTSTGSPDEQAEAGLDLLEDERRFIDLTASPLWLADEVVVRADVAEGERMTAALRRRPGLSRAEFQRYWLERHGPLALEHPDVFGFRHYVQLHTPDDAESFPPALARRAPAPFDGVSEIYRDPPTADPERLASVHAMIMEDEAKFVDYANSPTWWGRVEVVVDRA